MNINIKTHDVLSNIQNDGIAILDSQNLYQGRQYQQTSTIGSQMKNTYFQTPIQQVINTLGDLSAKAQGLKAIITTYDKMLNSDNVLFIKCSETEFLGFLKVGYKNLYHRDQNGKIHEIKPLCVLDFYVHESCQRTGFGKELFEKMLQYFSTQACSLGYDKPSIKLISFLKKHYHLANYVPQNNNYVVYNDYFITKQQSNHQQQLYKQTQDQNVQQQMPLKQIDFNPYEKQNQQNNSFKTFEYQALQDELLGKLSVKKQKFEEQKAEFQFSKNNSRQSTPQLTYPWATQQANKQYQTSSNFYGMNCKQKR